MSKRTEIHIGDKYGRLSIIKEIEPKICGNQSHRQMLCKCECGNVVKVELAKLVAGHTKSCGCLMKEVASKKASTHRLSKTKIYRQWAGMKRRCYKSDSDNYKWYGGRGIKVCDEWRNSFENFYNWSMNNGYSKDLSIDRIDNNGNYEPNNCRWVNREIQSNNRRTNIMITFQGETKSLTQWCRYFNINYSTTKNRILNLGWDYEKAFSTHVRRREQGYVETKKED